MGLTVRLAEAGEAEALLDLWRQAGAAPSATDSVERVTGAIEQAWLLVAEVDGERAGTLIAAWDGWRGTFYRLAVLPAYRRRGVALRLVREGEELLRGVGARRIGAVVLSDRDAALGFWEAAGYERQIEATRFTKLV
jgi:ribosomal protein S18 acetylase RimI-like enzyme